MTKDTKNGSKLYFIILKTWKNWESTRITSIPFPILKTSFPIPSGLIPVPATQIPFSQSKNRSIPVPILPLQDPLEIFHFICNHVTSMTHYIYNKISVIVVYLCYFLSKFFQRCAAFANLTYIIKHNGFLNKSIKNDVTWLQSK